MTESDTLEQSHLKFYTLRGFCVIALPVEFFNDSFCEINRMTVDFTTLLSSREQPLENNDLLHIPLKHVLVRLISSKSFQWIFQ